MATLSACGGAASGETAESLSEVSLVFKGALTVCTDSPYAPFVYGASSDPVTLDGAFVSDGESLRPIRQIFEGLVTTKPSSTEIQPQLAESWEASDEGKTWTFKLHTGVKFTDGTPFNAAAVCYNFDRWFNFVDPIQQTSAYYFQTVFGAFKDKAGDSLYDVFECRSTDDLVALSSGGRVYTVAVANIPSARGDGRPSPSACAACWSCCGRPARAC